MLEMKRGVLLLSVVLLTCAAPLHQNNESSSSQESQVTSRVITQFRGSDIIIKAPAGFGKPNEKGQSTVTVSLRDENTNVSINIVSFIFSVSSEEMSNAEVDENNEGFNDERLQHNGEGPEEKNNTDNDREMSKEGCDPTDLLHSDNELDKSEEETPNPRDYKSNEDQIHSTRVDSEQSDPDHPKVFETTATSSMQEDSNELEHQQPKAHTDRAEPSVQQYLPSQHTGLRLALASSLIHHETSSSEANDEGADSRSDINSVEGQTVPTISESISGPFQKASELSSSSEEERDVERKNSVTDSTPSKSPRLYSHPESRLNTEIVKKNVAPPAPLFSGSDIYPEYVNDWQYDPRYYELYRNHPGYAAEYDPYGAGYDPHGAGYDPYGAGYDPYGAGYDPYQAGYDPYQAGYDPYGAGYDPYQAGYDPYQAGYDNQDPYHKTESEDPRHGVEQETTPAYSVEENESHPTEISNIQDNSYSEEQPQSPSISPSSTPVSLPEGSENMDFVRNIPSEEPSNSTSIETSREMELQMATTGSFSSEESVETTDSDSQNPMNQPRNQTISDPEVQTPSLMSVVQLSPNIQEAHNKDEPQSQSPVDLIPAFSSEEDDPLVNPIKHIMALAFIGRSNVEGTNPDSSQSDNTISKNNQNEELFSNESATDIQGISAELTRESVHLTTESPPLESESAPTSDSLVSNEHTSSEKITPNPSTNLHITQSSGGLFSSAEANDNTANNSEESEESQIFTSSTAVPIASQPSQVQHTENSSDEENTPDRKSNQALIRQFPVATPVKTIATNLWTSFLQALKFPLANQGGQAVQKNVRRPQSTRRYHQRGNRRQKASSSEESK
ncbi:dentin sialophosphoprotein [Tachysurus ichikawai]